MNHKAFTLIELLVVVAIIGILAGAGANDIIQTEFDANGY